MFHRIRSSALAAVFAITTALLVPGVANAANVTKLTPSGEGAPGAPALTQFGNIALYAMSVLCLILIPAGLLIAAKSIRDERHGGIGKPLTMSGIALVTIAVIFSVTSIAQGMVNWLTF